MPESDPNYWPERAHNAAEVLRTRQLDLLANREYSYGQTRHSRQRPASLTEKIKTKIFRGRTG